MLRSTARIALALVLLSLLAACARTPARRTHSPTPSRTPTAVPAAATSPTPAPPPLPSPTPAGRLPAVLARLSISLPEGDAYNPEVAAFDEAGRAVVLCYYGGHPEAPASALIAVDPVQATRGPVLPLPGQAYSTLATGAGRAFVAYHDAEYHQRLAAVALDSGRIVADVPAAGLLSGAALAADAAGHLYALFGDRLEVRNPTTLQPLRSLPLPSASGVRMLALDDNEARLYLAVGSRLQAYRTPDLALLWEAPELPAEVRSLTVDRAGERVYAHCEGYERDGVVAYLFASASGTGQPEGRVPSPAGSTWRLVAADSAAGRLTFADPQYTNTRLWQTALDGTPTGAEAAVSGYAQVFGARERLLALAGGAHRVHILDRELAPLGEVATGVEIRSLAVDHAGERAYLNDSAGRLHLVDTQSHHLQATLAGVGSGELTLDAANGLAFVGREPWGSEVAVVDTAALTVTAVITGGYRVAVDSAGRRAFLGYTATGPEPAGLGGEVQVWDTRTFRRLGAIPQRGEPTYNPLRDEVYLRDYTAYIVDGRSLAVTGELTPDIGAEPLRWCNGCRLVERITVDAEQELIVISIAELSAGKGSGTMPRPRVLSARTRQPVTHAATILTSLWGQEPPLVIPPDEGRVYEDERYARYVVLNAAVAYEAGASEPSDYRDGLALDYYLPGRQVALDVQGAAILAYDPRTWEPLGWLPHYPINHVDLAGRRLYAWERSLLTVLSFDGGEPLPPAPPEPWPADEQPGWVQEIHLSPDWAHDGTAFVAAAGALLRSTDGGASWVLLPGPLPLAGMDTPNYRLALSPNYAQDRTLYLGGTLGGSMGLGVWRSTDGGDSWRPLWRGLTHLDTTRLVLSPDYAEDRTVLAYARYHLFWQGEGGTSLFRSTNGGGSWTQVATRSDGADDPPLPEPEELLPGLATDVRFRLGPYGQELLRSGDGGRNWRTVLRPERPGLVAPVLSPAVEGDGQLFALAPYALYRSTDAGLTWQAASDPRATRPDSGPMLTALAVGLDAAAQPVVALGDSAGSVAIVPAGDLGWQPLAPPPPTPVPTPRPTPCAAAVPQLGSWPQDLLGCPEGAPGELHMARQPFEGGLMFWLSDRREIYVLYSDCQANRWLRYPDTWQEGQPDRDPTLQPPPGREQPIRGFGRVWREELQGAQGVLGWALEGEKGYGGKRQAYTDGLVFTAPDGQAYALLADGTWVSP